MAIRTIEIMCIPCSKCAQLETEIRRIIQHIEQVNNIKIPYTFRHTTNLQYISNYALQPSQTPVVIINGCVESAGNVIPTLLKMKLESIHRIA